MCGRYEQSQTIEEYIAVLGWLMYHFENNSQAERKQNVSPGTYRPVLHVVGEERRADDLYWGYRPAWASEKLPVAVNARLEKITGSYWSRLLRVGRCIVPADGWYEWTGEKGAKLPWHIHRKDRTPLFMAGVANFGEFNTHKAEAGFAIVTAAAVGGMVDVHDRRPVVLSAEDAREWLDPDMPADQAEHLLRTAGLPAEQFEWYRVGTAVNRAGTEAPDLTDPIE